MSPIKRTLVALACTAAVAGAAASPALAAGRAADGPAGVSVQDNNRPIPGNRSVAADNNRPGPSERSVAPDNNRPDAAQDNNRPTTGALVASDNNRP
ncbi:hypothetical protein A6A06_39105 [Streptomyces sp. CB02923]|uniref:hypothetical protein n=1 Tax=Streptomyces sp. CB02923 TaxID=1718985 RepID=UPI00093C524C|nr:hypothetical protein [Streptomyces sp. CB02923]OKI03483.1 hypothetical protein A6A06_39105 [Streptomyces sp. CB02923]